MPAIEQFKRDHPRRPFPDNFLWIADSAERYNRNHWLVIDELRVPGQPGIVQIRKAGNAVDILSEGVRSFSLLLNPEQFDFDTEVIVRVNGGPVFDDLVRQDAATLLDNLHRSLDRALLVTAALSIEVP